MILAAHQPQFIPWLGYFEKMLRADVFVILDDVQFKKNEWQNRNKIWSREGGQWLTVPVLHDFGQEIREVKINETAAWRDKQLKTLKQTYGKAKHFEACNGPWEAMYGRTWETLGELNLHTLNEIRKVLKIETRMPLSSTLGVEGKSTERLVNLCKKLGADVYLAGAGGQDYMDMSLFDRAGIKVGFQDFHHPVYPQFNGQFLSHLTALDMIFHCGAEAAAMLRAANP